MGHWFSKEVKSDTVVNGANVNQIMPHTTLEQQANPDTYIFYTSIAFIIILVIAYKINKYYKSYVYKKLNLQHELNKIENA